VFWVVIPSEARNLSRSKGKEREIPRRYVPRNDKLKRFFNKLPHTSKPKTAISRSGSSQ
jgi:hypothetical protein